MGLKDQLLSGTEPWLCYYCGDCSKTCPRDANPGELMMTARRWLTTQYDWTGLAGVFYRSLTATVIAFVLIALGILGVGYALNWNQEAIMHIGHRFEMFLILGVFALILLPNLVRMLYLTVMKPGVKAPLGTYVRAVGNLFLHMFTQKKTLKCEEQTFRWLSHFFVVIGYIGLLVTTVFLNWFQTESLFVLYLGYFTGALVFIFTLTLMIPRIMKTRELNKFSHPTDWFFVIWLFLMGISAVGVRLFIDFNLLSNNFWLYMVHIIILAQWGMILVPFGKWTHFLYRSFAISFSDLKAADRSGEAVSNLAPAV